MSNSAQRLHDALVALREHSQPRRFDVTWPDAFGTGKLTTPQFLRQLAKFLELPAVVRSEVEAVDAELPADLLLEWFPRLEEALRDVQPGTGVASFVSNISEEMLLGLRFCATILQRHLPEKFISAELLSNLLEKANELRQEIRESNLEFEVRRILIERLDDVILALVGYRITGSRGIEDAFEAILGSLVRENDAWEQAGDTTVGRKVFNFVKNLGIIISFAWTAVQLTDRVTHHLSNSSEPTIQVEINESPKNETPKESGNRRRHHRSIEI